MRNWLFILGRQADIALAELVSLLKIRQIQYSPKRVGLHEIIITTKDDLGDLQSLLNHLGGTIKIILLDAEVPLKNSDNFKESLEELLKTDEIYKTYHVKLGPKKDKKSRWTFGISVAAPGINKRLHRQLGKVIHGIALKAKRDLKSKNISSRFVAARGKSMSLSSVVVRKNKLNTPAGTEITILAAEHSIWRGQTVAVQDFEAYGKRDFGRPARNPRAGSLPPKLAQIMINLAGLKEGTTIYDPFAGQGTLLQEGALMGYNMLGSDVDKRQVTNANQNLFWLKEQGLIEQKPQVWQADVKKIKLPTPTAAIVTEGILGPPHSLPLSPDQAAQSSLRIANMWRKILVDAGAQSEGALTIVCTWPVLQKRDKSYQFIDILDDLTDLGYRLSVLIPDNLRDSKTNDLTSRAWRKRGTLIYSRPGQVVLREIIRLIKL